MRRLIDVHTHMETEENSGEWARFLAECRKNGVSIAIVSALGAWERYPSPETVRQSNLRAERFVAFGGGLLRRLVYLNPQNDNWRDELEYGLSRGAIGVKLWVSLKDAAGDMGRTLAVCRRAGEMRAPLLLHTFGRTDPLLPGEVNMEEFAALAEQAPNATLIAAHASAGWQGNLGVLRGRAENACVDICGCIPDKGLVEALVRDLGAHRVLFGSDMLGRSLPSQIAKVTLADLSDEDKELILWKNAARIFGLADVPAAQEDTGAFRSASELPRRDEDHCCFCGRWPFLPTPCAGPADLEDELRGQNVSRAYTGNLGSIYRLDLDAANAAFLEECSGCGRVAPLAAVNPRTVNWRQVLRALGPGFAGVIAYPYLHNWRLDSREAAELARACAAASRPMWINLCLGDYRFRHSGVAPRPVSTEEVLAFLAVAPRPPCVFQGASLSLVQAALNACGRAADVRFDISRLTDATGHLDRALSQCGLPNLVMGSEFPLRDMREVWWTALRQ